MKNIFITISKPFVNVWRFLTVMPEKPEYIVGQKAYRADRLLAEGIDSFIQNLLIIPVFIYLGVTEIKDYSFVTVDHLYGFGYVVIVVFQGYLLYRHAQIIGKYVTGIRIENLDGTRANFLK